MRGRSDGPALARQYLDALRHQRRLSPATLTNYAHALQALFKLLKEGDLALLDAAQVRRFVAVMHSRGLGPRSLALMLSAWRGFYHWLVRHHGFGANPVVGVRAPKAPRPLPKALSVEAAQRLLDEKPGSPQLMGKPWGKGEKKQSIMVFIGKKLPKDIFIAGMEECLAK